MTAVPRPQRPVRILILSTFLTKDQAGAAQSIITIARALSRTEWADVTVAAQTWDEGTFSDNVRLVRLEAEAWPGPFWRLFPLTHYWHARRVIRDNKLGDFDVCYTQSIAYGLAYRAEFPGIPIVSHPGAVLWERELMEESTAPLRWRRFQAWIARRLERRSYTEPRWLHVASSRLVADARTEAFHLAEGTFRIAPLPIDPMRFDPARVTRDVRSELGIGRDAFVVIVVARLVAWKRVDAVIRAIAGLGPNVKLLVVGEGPERGALESLTRELGVGDRVYFAGRQDPPPYFAAGDLFVLPSLIESLGLVYLEAMMMGLPCIGLSYQPPKILSAASEVIVEDETGFCVDDDDALRERIARLADDRERCRAMGARARELALERYTPDRYVELLRSESSIAGQYSKGNATRFPSRADR
ncbi:MAG TPA: glycosyltransferase family 4 protein [Gemmatimonadaceae bacterium]